MRGSVLIEDAPHRLDNSLVRRLQHHMVEEKDPLCHPVVEAGISEEVMHDGGAAPSACKLAAAALLVAVVCGGTELC